MTPVAPHHFLGKLRLLLSPGLGLIGILHAEPFRDGDRWLSIGDSILHHGAFHTDVECFYFTRYPNLSLAAINGGIDGDTATNAIKRLAWDVMPEKPSIVSIMLGMNDIDRDLYLIDDSGEAIEKRRRLAVDDYGRSMLSLVRDLQGSGIRVIILAPTPFDNTAVLERVNRPGANAALAECARRARLIASETDCPFIDFHGPMTDLNLARHPYDPSFTIVASDRVHPGAPGQLAMAYFFLKSQGVSPTVAYVRIDAGATRAGVCENCEVGNLRREHSRVSFQYRAHALPFPVDPEARPALELLPITNDLNRETFQIGGLENGAFELRIDSVLIGTFSGKALGEGVNLASNPDTPESRQAEEVAVLLKQKALIEVKLRNIAWVEHTALMDEPRSAGSPEVQPLLAAQLSSYKGKGKAEAEVAQAHRDYLETKPIQEELKRERDEIADRARRAAQPKPHEIELVRVESTAGSNPAR